MNQIINTDTYINDRKCTEHSVHFGKGLRAKTAKEQAKNPPADEKEIIRLTNSFLEACNIKVSTKECFCVKNMKKNEQGYLYELNKNIQNYFPDLTSCKDIIWMKFTTTGHLGVVACSNDINFNYPSNSDDYHVRGKGKRWKYNTSGILVHMSGLEWDEDKILIFPLPGLPTSKEGTKKRHALETGIGNYLTSNNIPLIDYYSHRI